MSERYRFVVGLIEEFSEREIGEFRTAFIPEICRWRNAIFS